MTDPWRSHAARIVRISDEIPGVRTYELVFEDRGVRDTYRFAAGQFNMLHLPGIGEAAISISSDRGCPDRLAHTVRAVGNVTTALARLSEGACVLVRGPFGTPWPTEQGRAGDGDIVFVAGGLGLASQRTAILDAVERRSAFGRVVVIHGAKRPDGLLYAREYDGWRAAGLEVELVVDDPGSTDAWRGHVGNVVTALESIELDVARSSVLACGPDAMMTAVADAAIGLGVAAERVFVSLERNMACAVRHCGLCQFGPEFVCQDGPVFPFPRIARYLAVPRL
jgi:NAD(P)H-flavin reductase